MLFFVGQLFAYIYPYSISRKVYLIKKYIYTGYISKGFKTFGKSEIHPKARLLVGAKYMSVGDGTSIGKNIQLTAWDIYQGISHKPEIVIGNNVLIGDSAHISAINRIVIGDGVITGKMILITDNAHGKSNSELLDTNPLKRPLFSKGTVLIENNVWIGDKVSIMPNVRIGKGSVIAANSVVTKDVPPYSIVAGIAGRIVKQLR